MLMPVSNKTRKRLAHTSVHPSPIVNGIYRGGIHWGYLSGGYLSGGYLSAGYSSAGVVVRVGSCPGGICPRG